MKRRRIDKQMIRQAAMRAFIYNLGLEVILWGLVLFAVSRHHLVTILSYELILQLIIMLMLGIYGITLAVFAAGIAAGVIKAGKEEQYEETV